MLVFFFFNDTATTEIYTLSLHDALPISGCAAKTSATVTFPSLNLISLFAFCFNIWLRLGKVRSEERFSRNAETDLVCRLLLEKKKKKNRNRARWRACTHAGGGPTR